MKYEQASDVNCNYNCSVSPAFDELCDGSDSGEAVAGQGSLATLSDA